MGSEQTPTRSDLPGVSGAFGLYLLLGVLVAIAVAVAYGIAAKPSDESSRRSERTAVTVHLAEILDEGSAGVRGSIAA